MTAAMDTEAVQGRIVVVKYGGNAMTDQMLKAAFADDIVFPVSYTHLTLPTICSV